MSLFCGALSVESKVSGFNRVICNDACPYIIELFKCMQKGYQLPDFVSEEEYKYIRDNKDEDKALTGFVGFGCSFGGKWFGGYARDKRGANYALESKNSLFKKINHLQNAEFICSDYKEVKIPKGSVVYADPPYQGTTGYKFGTFNRDEFWDYMRLISKDNKVYISEQSAPSDFVSVWERQVNRSIDVNINNNKVVERLFIQR